MLADFKSDWLTLSLILTLELSQSARSVYDQLSNDRADNKTGPTLVCTSKHAQMPKTSLRENEEKVVTLPI